MDHPVRIGIIGTGFARRVMLPAFTSISEAQVVAVTSAHRENADAAAESFSIDGIYTDHREMLGNEALDLAVITTPPHLHWPMSRDVLEAGVNVLCEKPTALDLGEARQMYELAESKGLIHLIDHELRFHPTLQRLKAEIGGGALGEGGPISFTINWVMPMPADRPWNWWSDKSKGGGLLGAIGSHQIDLIRWLLGEVARVKGRTAIQVGSRPTADGAGTRDVTSDDYASFQLELEKGAIGTITLDGKARPGPDGARWQMAFHGSKASLYFDGQERLWRMSGGSDAVELEPVSGDPQVPGLPEGLFPRGFGHFSRAIVKGLSMQTPIDGAATFYDGMRVQAVLDAVRASSEAGDWRQCSV